MVTTVREVLGKGNDFATKSTYSATDPKGQLQRFRTSASLRVAVTVDMIATGTDVKPLECVFFMRDVRSAQYFEQMKGRGARTIAPADVAAVTSDAGEKTRFVIVDAVGVTEHEDAAARRRRPGGDDRDPAPVGRGLLRVPLIRVRKSVGSPLTWGFVLREYVHRAMIEQTFERCGGVVDALMEALDALEHDDLHNMSAADQLARSAALVSAKNRLDAQLARSARVADLTQAPEHDGSRTMRSWLRGHARLSPAAAAQVVRNGRTMERLPGMAAGCMAGVITAEQVSVVAPVVAPANLEAAAEQDVDLAEIDAVLASTAATREHVHLGRVVNHYLSLLNPDGTEPDPTEQRSLRITKHSDGSLSGSFDLDAVGGEKVQSVLESFVQADRPAGDMRTRSQQLGDALVQWADVTLASGRAPILRTVKPHVVALIKVDDLADPETVPDAADMGFGATISAARARWLACDGNVSRVVMGPEGEVLDHGRSKRIVPPALRRAVEIQDRHCVFAGCEAPTHWCDVHHVQEWVLHEGPTSLENSALLCERHHTKVHHGFRVERQPDGRCRTWRPDGTEIVIYPPLRI